MNRIDKLILQARNAVRPGLELTVALIERNGDSWTAQAHLWDGTLGHTPTIKRATYATLEAAVEHIHTMSMEYPNSKDVPIIIDDLGGVIRWQSV